MESTSDLVHLLEEMPKDELRLLETKCGIRDNTPALCRVLESSKDPGALLCGTSAYSDSRAWKHLLCQLLPTQKDLWVSISLPEGEDTEWRTHNSWRNLYHELLVIVGEKHLLDVFLRFLGDPECPTQLAERFSMFEMARWVIAATNEGLLDSYVREGRAECLGHEMSGEQQRQPVCAARPAPRAASEAPWRTLTQERPSPYPLPRKCHQLQRRPTLRPGAAPARQTAVCDLRRTSRSFLLANRRFCVRGCGSARRTRRTGR